MFTRNEHFWDRSNRCTQRWKTSLLASSIELGNPSQRWEHKDICTGIEDLFRFRFCTPCIPICSVPTFGDNLATCSVTAINKMRLMMKSFDQVQHYINAFAFGFKPAIQRTIGFPFRQLRLGVLVAWGQRCE